MRGRTRQLPIAVAITIIDVTASNDYWRVIGEAFARDMLARPLLLWVLSLAIASEVVIRLHVVCDLRQPPLARSENHAFGSLAAPSDERSVRYV
jgi:hypothetical protein